MFWWQIALILAGAVVVGVAAGYLLNRAFTRAPAPRPAPVRRQEAPTTAAAAPEPVAAVAVASPEKVKQTIHDIFAELEHNRLIAAADWTGVPQSFVTRAWDERGNEANGLPADVRSELVEAYSDMALANSITWLSTEMGRRSQSLDESYLRLRSSVAEHLNRAKLQLTLPGEPPKVAAPR